MEVLNDLVKAFDFIPTFFNAVVNSKIHVYLMNHFFETTVLLDSIICSFVFLKDMYELPKLNNLNLNPSELKIHEKHVYSLKQSLVEKYNNLYRLVTFDRYGLYLAIYVLNYILTNLIIKFNDVQNIHIMRIFLLLITIPPIQNAIFDSKYIKPKLIKYKINRYTFVRYSLSKLLVHFVENLHSDIIKIPNLHIFILYNNISINFIYGLIKNYLFISLLYFLKYSNTGYLYYYYKGIKAAYLYHTGYMFNVIPLQDAVYLANMIIKEKRWHDLSKTEIVNAFYVLISSKFTNEHSSIYISSSIVLFQCFSIWSIVSLIKVVIRNITFIAVLFTILAPIIIFRSTKNKIKNIITGIILAHLLIFNTNDIIITLFLLSHRVVYYILEELYFFILNSHNIKKVIDKYDTNQKKGSFPFDFNTI
jgi:hypothetical protein